MSSRHRYDIPELFPQPKQIIVTEGESDLSTDIRLVTSNVLPLQRKAIRSVLTNVGIKVVANKKRYVVDVSVKTPDAFDLSDVPAAVRNEYYEIDITGSEIHVSTPEQNGTIWASHTLAAIFRHVQHGGKMPNMLIRDWPAMQTRGVFVESKWGPDRMTLPDWYQTIDTLADMKLNTLGIGVYGCWGECRFENDGGLTEFLMVPVKDRDDLRKVHTLRWFSPADDKWKVESYQAYVCQNDFFGDIVAYGRERGVNIVPYVNSLGHNTFLPRMIPEISAKDENGNPTHAGYCLSNPETLKFIENFYTSIIERYYPGGCDTFHVQMDEIHDTNTSPDDTTVVASPWCQCPKCKAQSREKLLGDYILWLTQMLASKGVKHVAIWNDMLTGPMNILTDDFARRLEDAGLKDKLIIDCWDYNNVKLNPDRSPELAAKHGLQTWVTPMTCYYDWSTYNHHVANIDLMMRLGYQNNSLGAVSYAVHNAAHTDHEAVLAAYAWEDAQDTASPEYLKRWAVSHFNDDAKNYLQIPEMLKNVAWNVNFTHTLFYQYSYCRNLPAQYPKVALERLEQLPDDPVPVQTKFVEDMAAADAILVRLLEREGLDTAEKDCLKALRGHAARMAFLMKAFSWLLTLRKELAATGCVKKSQAAACQKLLEDLKGHLAIVEKDMPSYIAPACLAALSPLYAFLEQLNKQLAEFAGRKKAAAILWA